MKDTARKNWNERHKRLRILLSDPTNFPLAIELFLQQHAEVHSGIMSSAGSVSFEDEVIDDMTTEQIRDIHEGMDHSIAWILWHLARIEDVTMNMLVAAKKQVFEVDKWSDKLSAPLIHTGNALSNSNVTKLSREVNIDELRNYRVTVGRQTEEIVKHLDPADINLKVDLARLELVMQEGVLVEDAREVFDYWSTRTIAGLLLMPPTRHCLIHLNEAARIKDRVT